MGFIDALVISHEPLTELDLKRIILLFDRVYIFQPEESLFFIPEDVVAYKAGDMEFHIKYGYVPLFNGTERVGKEYRVLNQVEYAVKKGVVRPLNLRARSFYEKNWLPLRLAYDFDTGNADLLNATKPLHIYSEEKKNESGMLRGCFLEPTGMKIYPDIPEVPNVFDESIKEKFDLEAQAFSVIAHIDRGLAVAGEYGFVPLFLNNKVAQIYALKNSLASQNPESEVKDQFKRAKGVELQRVQHILHRIASKMLPDEVLRQIPIKDLIIARDNTFHKLAKIRRDVFSKLNILIRASYEDGFHREVEEYILKEFEPKLKSYYSNFWDLLAKFTGTTATFSGAAIGATIGLSQELSPKELAFLSGISASVGSVASNLADYVVSSGREKFRNTFSYFLDLRELSSS